MTPAIVAPRVLIPGVPAADRATKSKRAGAWPRLGSKASGSGPKAAAGRSSGHTRDGPQHGERGDQEALHTRLFETNAASASAMPRGFCRCSMCLAPSSTNGWACGNHSEQQRLPLLPDR